MKVTHIVLSQGRQVSQLMLTRHSGGTLGGAIREAQILCQELSSQGFPISRIKIEISADHSIAPPNNNEATQKPEKWYFEHHVKLLLAAEQDMAELERIARKHDSRLSRNAFRKREDSREERFVTQRFYRTGRDEAKISLMRLLENLSLLSVIILESEAEYVVYDTNLSMDDGWLDTI